MSVKPDCTPMDAFILMEQIHMIESTIVAGLSKHRGMYNEFSFHCERLERMKAFIVGNYAGENALKVTNAIDQADARIVKKFDSYNHYYQF